MIPLWCLVNLSIFAFINLRKQTLNTIQIRKMVPITIFTRCLSSFLRSIPSRIFDFFLFLDFISTCFRIFWFCLCNKNKPILNSIIIYGFYFFRKVNDNSCASDMGARPWWWYEGRDWFGEIVQTDLNQGFAHPDDLEVQTRRSR